MQSLKRRLLPDERLIIFGSHVRGARPDSDCGLPVLPDKSKREFDDFHNQDIK